MQNYAFALKRTPFAALPLILFSLVLVGYWYNVQVETTGKQEQGQRYHGIEEARIQRWIKESELIWKRGIVAREAAEVVSKFNPYKPWSTVHHRNIWDFFYPTYNCPRPVERLGRLGDGGKWVCGISHFAETAHPCVVFSYGISGDSSFEEDILKRTKCYVYAYDHTVDPSSVALTKLYPNRSKFTKLGIGTEDKGRLRTLKTEMERHGKKFIDILKIDVEGAEVSVIPQILSDFPKLPIGQLLIEVHLGSFSQYNLYQKLKTWWTSLERAGLRPFRAEPNLIALLLGSKPHPTYYEISFLNVESDHVLLHA